MDSLWNRLESRTEGLVVKSSGAAYVEVLGRLESGEEPARLTREMGLEPADLIAVLARAALGDEGSFGPALTRTPPGRPGLRDALAEGCPGLLPSTVSRGARLAMAAALLQIHDFWDESHDAAQQADDLGEPQFSAYWHGIAHRREPDSGNAKYWFRRVGRHSLFDVLGASATRLLDDRAAPELTARLTAGGAWNPGAFIDLCADGRPRGVDTDLLRTLQRLEMSLSLEATARSAGLT